MRKLIPLVGSVALSAVMLSTAALAAGPLPFTDVKDGDWYRSSVEYVYEKKLMEGVSDELFAPGAMTTRAMVVTILHRMEGAPAADAVNFTDVEQGKWYADAVNWAAANGIVNGTGEATFSPGDDVTREQLAAILYRYALTKGQTAADPSAALEFADADQVASYAADAMRWMTAHEIITGVDGNRLAPKDGASRAQIAAVLMRLDQLLSGAPAQEKSFTVTFHGNYDGAADATQTVKDGAAAARPADPARSGYTFDGWFTGVLDGDQYDFTKAVTADLDLYAHWTQVVSGGAGGAGGGGGTPEQPDTHTQKEIEEEEQIVSYIQEVLDGYAQRSAIIKDQTVKDCYELLISTMRSAVQDHNNGEFVDKDYINETYANNIDTVKKQYRAFTKQQRAEFLDVGAGLAEYDHLMQVMDYFGVSSSSF